MISAEMKPSSPDRILILEPMDGKPLDTRGIVDPRLFKSGEDGNKLHAVMDTETTLWTFKYEKGIVPPALKGSFTGFRALMKHAVEYFKQRNITVTEAH